MGIAQIELMAIGIPIFSSGREGSKEVLNKYNSENYLRPLLTFFQKVIITGDEN